MVLVERCYRRYLRVSREVRERSINRKFVVLE
jgi:hypothetical protein